MKKIFIVSAMLLFSFAAFSQSKDAENIKAVLKQYNFVIEKLDATVTEKLFTTDSKKKKYFKQIK